MTLLHRVHFDIGHPTLVWTSLEYVPSVKGATIKSITWSTCMSSSTHSQLPSSLHLETHTPSPITQNNSLHPVMDGEASLNVQIYAMHSELLWVLGL